MAGPGAFLLLFGFVLIKTAWVSDDAFITLRTVDNFTNGLGLTWNPSERVQVYTHPFWMFILSGLYVMIGNPILTAVIASIVFSLFALYWAARRVAISPGHAMLGLTILLMSRAFVDYSTSGLENPLTHALLGLGMWWSVHHPPGEKRHLFWITFIAGLAVFNRLDSGAFFLPVLLTYWWKTPGRVRNIGLALLALSPFLLWEVFALIYYGFLFQHRLCKVGCKYSYQCTLVSGHSVLCSVHRDQIRSPSLPSPAV